MSDTVIPRASPNKKQYSVEVLEREGSTVTLFPLFQQLFLCLLFILLSTDPIQFNFDLITLLSREEGTISSPEDLPWLLEFKKAFFSTWHTFLSRMDSCSHSLVPVSPLNSTIGHPYLSGRYTGRYTVYRT